MKNMEVPQRWELHLAHFELDHPLGFSLNPLWKVWVLLAPQVLAELSHTVGARNPKPKNQYNQSMNNEKYGSTATLRATLGTLRAGSPFRVLPQPSLEGMSALSTPSVAELSHTVGARNPKPKKRVYWKSKIENSKLQTPKSKHQNPRP